MSSSNPGPATAFNARVPVVPHAPPPPPQLVSPRWSHLVPCRPTHPTGPPTASAWPHPPGAVLNRAETASISLLITAGKPPSVFTSFKCEEDGGRHATSVKHSLALPGLRRS
ncbi:unnamed protein product [Gadus morhua 'NCC']